MSEEVVPERPGKSSVVHSSGPLSLENLPRKHFCKTSPSLPSSTPGSDPFELTKSFAITTPQQVWSPWSGFHKKTVKERRDQLSIVYPSLNHQLLCGGGGDASRASSPVEGKKLSVEGKRGEVTYGDNTALPSKVADVMVENCVGVFPLPVGLGLHLLVNGKPYQVPMVTEEPSVIAAVSGASKVVAQGEGFVAETTGSTMTGQVQLLDIPDCAKAAKILEEKKADLVEAANNLIPSMVQRGGGVVEMSVRIICPKRTPQPEFIVVHFYIAALEAMGANMVNTVCEGMKSVLTSEVGGRAGLGILSNLCDKRIAISEFRLPISMLKWHSFEGELVAKRIVEAYWFAEEDPYRAATHNKGILNGIDALAVATGQDWRAIESGAHSYAARDGSYRPLTQYSIEDGMFVGRIELPMAVGSRGGALQTHPLYAYTHKLLGNPDAATLAQILASVGLAQNFAALRALALEGIQKGHMSLHSRNIAVAAGSPHPLVPEVANYLVSRGTPHVNVKAAEDYLDAHAQYKKLNQGIENPVELVTPSMLYVEVYVREVNESVKLNIALSNLRDEAVYMVMGPSHSNDDLVPIQRALFSDKGYTWIQTIFDQFRRLGLKREASPRSTWELCNKLKLVCVLINATIQRLLIHYPKPTKAFLRDMMSGKSGQSLNEAARQNEDEVLLVGLPLLYALYQNFIHHVDQWIFNDDLKEALVEEMNFIIQALSESPPLDNFDHFMELHVKRWPATLTLLCDGVLCPVDKLSSDMLRLVCNIGVVCEYEGTIAHDIARYRRDGYREKVANSYSVWLSCRGLDHSEENLEKFDRKVSAENDARMSKLREHQDTLSAIFDFSKLDVFRQTVRNHYQNH